MRARQTTDYVQLDLGNGPRVILAATYRAAMAIGLAAGNASARAHGLGFWVNEDKAKALAAFSEYCYREGAQ